MFVFNAQHPRGAETGVVVPDRLPFANAQQNRAIAAHRLVVEQRDRQLYDMLNSIGNQMGDSPEGIAMQNASPLHRDVWGEWDREGIEVQREVLAVFGDLSAAVGSPIPVGKLVSYFQQISDSGEVNVSMDGRSKAKTDQPTIDYEGVPIPIFDSRFSFGWRQMMAAASEGIPLDPAARRNAMFKVAESLELMAINGRSDVVVAGAQLYGLTNHPQRNTRATGITINGETGPNILAEVIATLELLHADNFKVPATLYMNWDDWFYCSETDFSTQYPNKTIAQRILEVSGVREVIPADKLAANTIIALVKDRRVVEVKNAMPMATRQQFRANPEDDHDFVTMAIQSLQLKFDSENQMGLAHSS